MLSHDYSLLHVERTGLCQFAVLTCQVVPQTAHRTNPEEFLAMQTHKLSFLEVKRAGFINF